MTAVLLPAAVFILLVAQGGSPPALVPSVFETQARVFGVSLTDTEAKVRAAIGTPVDVESTLDEMEEAPARTLRYQGIVVHLVADEVYRMSCVASRCAMPSGVRVGSSPQQVIAAYGPADDVTIESNRFLRYNIKGSDAWLDFRISDERVVEIVMWFDYS